MRISDWSSDVCSSDLQLAAQARDLPLAHRLGGFLGVLFGVEGIDTKGQRPTLPERFHILLKRCRALADVDPLNPLRQRAGDVVNDHHCVLHQKHRSHEQCLCPPLSQCGMASRSEEHTSELQSLMRISYAVFCLKKKIQ